MNLINTYSGYFTDGKVEGEFIEKKISFHSADENLLYRKIFKCDQNVINQYYQELLSANIMIPNTVAFFDPSKGVLIRQNFVSGVRLIEWIKNHNIVEQYDAHIYFFKKLLLYQRNAYIANTSIRIDFNLQNFVLKGHQVFLVDVVPPLYLDFQILKKWENSSEKIGCLLNLYYNIDWQIIAIIGYWLQEKIEELLLLTEPNRKNIIKVILTGFLNEANKVLSEYTDFNFINKDYIYINKKIIYFYKLYLIFEYLNDGLTYEEMLIKYLKPAVKTINEEILNE